MYTLQGGGIDVKASDVKKSIYCIILIYKNLLICDSYKL